MLPIKTNIYVFVIVQAVLNWVWIKTMFSVFSKIDIKEILGEENSLKKTLMLNFLTVGLVPLLIISALAAVLSSNMSTNAINQNLEALKANKVVAIENYGNTIVNQVITASEDPNLAQNLVDITRAFDQVTAEYEAASATSDANYVETLRSELGNYYRNEFLPQYQSVNQGQSADVGALLRALPDDAVVLQHAYIYKNPAPIGNKHEMFSSALGSSYDRYHDLIHQSLKIYLEKFGYYDIFLVDTNGRVVYSVYKELDYATNLLNGAYANSGLGQAFQASLSLAASTDFALIDYAQYKPSYEAPASFIASPIFNNGQRVGSLVYQMPLDAITTVMSERRGLGVTGESYLVGQDSLMRSDSIKFPEEFSVDASFRNNTSVQSQSIKLGLDGQSGVIETENYKGESVISGYIPVKFGSLNWTLIAEIETSEAYGPVNFLVWLIVFIVVAAIAATIFVSMRVSNKIVSPVKAMQMAMAKIAQSANFNERVEVETKDEIGQSAQSLNMLLESLEVSLKETNQVVTAMANGDFSQRVSSNVSGDLLALKEGVNQSASDIESAIKEVNTVVTAFAQGDFSQQIKADLKGELEALKTGVNVSSTSMASAFMHLGKVMSAMSAGDFKFKAEADLIGEYAVIADKANAAMKSIDAALNEIDTVMSSVAEGDLDARVDGQVPGQLDTIKVNLNASLDVINNVFHETETVMQSIADGSTKVQISGDFPGQFDTLKTNINMTASKLSDVVHEIIQASDGVKASAEDIAKGNISLNQRTEQQASNLEQTAASMDEITNTVKHTATNASHANKISAEAKEKASIGGQVVSQAVQAMEEINESSSKIADIISVIDAIAFQTNLLALNAAVEAARAGEQGKGFAVVASEVRNLAGRSANAAKEIKNLIDDSVEKVTIGSELVSKSGKTLEEIIHQVENVSGIVNEISTAADEQSTGIDEIHSALEQLHTLTQQNTAMVEEATAAGEQLNTQAKSMSQLIMFFDA